MTNVQGRELDVATASHAKPGSKEWLEARRNGLGASEVAAVFGLDKYTSPFDLWLQKKGEAPERVGDSPQARRGRFAEAGIADEYAEVTGDVLVRVPTVKHPDLPILFASADRMAVEAKVDGAQREFWRYPVEIKNRGGFPRGFGESGTDQVPDAIAVQVHVQMACYDLNEARVAVV